MKRLSQIGSWKRLGLQAALLVGLGAAFVINSGEQVATAGPDCLEEGDCTFKKPNFLIIMADDCTYNDLPAYGGQNAKTPNIDRLASQGVLFEEAYSQTNVTNPSHVAIFTGLYAIDSGVMNNITPLPSDVLTLAGHESLMTEVTLATASEEAALASTINFSVDGATITVASNKKKLIATSGPRR